MAEKIGKYEVIRTLGKGATAIVYLARDPDSDREVAVKLIRFGEETEDEVYITCDAAQAGVEVVNTGAEPPVGLSYFGPGVHAKGPAVGGYLKQT